MSDTLLKLQRAHSKAARVSGQLALAMACKRLKRTELEDMKASLNMALAEIESLINAQD